MSSAQLAHYLALSISLTLTVVVGIYAWQRRGVPGIKHYALLMLAEASWITGYIFELASQSLQGKIFWDNFQFIGSMFVPLLLLIFAFEYTGFQGSLSRTARIGLFIFPVIFLLFLFTNPLHGLVRTTAGIVPGEPFNILLYEYTIPMWVSFVYSYLTYIFATILFVRNLMRQQRLFRTQTSFILAGFIFTFIGSLPGFFGILIFGQRDITPYTFGIGNLIFAWGLFRYGIFGILPIARDIILEHMSDIVIVIDTNSRIVDANPAAVSGLGIPAKELIGTSVSQVIPENNNFLQFLEKDEPSRQEVVYTDRTGNTYILDAFISPLRDQHNRLLGRLVVARDVTEQNRMKTKLRKAYEELELRVKQRTVELNNANLELEAKNNELERFTYTVSHDLKSPLITVKGFLSYLEDDIASGNSDRAKQDIQRISRAVDNMQALLDDLLELSRIGRIANEPEQVPFNTLCEEVLDILHGQLEARDITVKLKPDLPTVFGDRQRLKEVLQNLIENATKFMGDQTNPVIEIGQQGTENGHPVFFVKDNGVGIAPEYHERIFNLFERFDTKTEGTGIGLAVVKRIIELHGGRIWVESEPGKGSTFYFTIKGGADD